MRLLLIAAVPPEFDGILRHCTGVIAAQEKPWRRSGNLNGHFVTLAAAGVGAARAARAMDADPRADAVVSLGFCGALDAELGPGHLFVGLCVRSDQGSYPAIPLSAGVAHARGTVWTSARVVRTAAEKARLRERGAGVVDMEAAGVAAEAARRGIPFSCVKAVSDLACETLVTDFEAALRPDGHFDTMHLLRQSLSNPGASIKELVRLHRRCGIASRNLGDFFADCRF